MRSWSIIVKDTKLELATVTKAAEKVKRALVAPCCCLAVQKAQRALDESGDSQQLPADIPSLLETEGLVMRFEV